MCALSPLFQSSSLGWPLMDNVPIGNEQFSHYYQTPNSFEPFLLPSPPSCSEIFNGNNNGNNGNNLYGYGGSNGGGDEGIVVVKKLSHNASERERRKTLSSLYSSLRSLLPASDQNKKLSIAATVSNAVKYIPELQQELERLSNKRDDIQRRVWRQRNDLAHEEKTKGKAGSSDCAPRISVTRFSDAEIGIQIWTMQGNTLSNVLMGLEEEGVCVKSASSFVSCGQKIFYDVHLQVEGSCELNCEKLRDRILDLSDKRDELLPRVQAAQVWS